MAAASSNVKPAWSWTRYVALGKRAGGTGVATPVAGGVDGANASGRGTALVYRALVTTAVAEPAAPAPPPPMSPALEAERRAALRRMKAIATALLVGAAVVFVVTKALEDSVGWLAPVRATAEASMIGALADWFAVTALFRHPLGLPIPHTAIIPANKDRIGRALGVFLQQN